jgi:hypothetical protein
MGKRHKYGVSPKADRTMDGITYASKAEMIRAYELKLAARTFGWIIIQQPKFHLGCPENTYVADFQVQDGSYIWVEDVKGVTTAKFRHDVKLWRAYGPYPLRILKRTHNGWTTETIEPIKTA